MTVEQETFLRILTDFLKKRASCFGDKLDWNAFLELTVKHQVSGIVYWQCNKDLDDDHKMALQKSFSAQLYYFANRKEKINANCKCKLDTRMNKNCSAQAGLDYHTASTAGAVKDAAGKAEPIP